MATYVTTYTTGAYTIICSPSANGSVHKDIFKNGAHIGYADKKNGYIRYYGEPSRTISATSLQAARWWRHAERIAGREVHLDELPDFMETALAILPGQTLVKWLDVKYFDMWQVIDNE